MQNQMVDSQPEFWLQSQKTLMLTDPEKVILIIISTTIIFPIVIIVMVDIIMGSLMFEVPKSAWKRPEEQRSSRTSKCPQGLVENLALNVNLVGFQPFRNPKIANTIPTEV